MAVKPPEPWVQRGDRQANNAEVTTQKTKPATMIARGDKRVLPQVLKSCANSTKPSAARVITMGIIGYMYRSSLCGMTEWNATMISTIQPRKGLRRTPTSANKNSGRKPLSSCNGYQYHGSVKAKKFLFSKLTQK